MRKASYLLILALFGVGSHPSFTDFSVELIQEEAAIGTTDDPNARAAFEQLQIRHPITLDVPHDIRQRELTFAKSHPTKHQFLSARGEASQLENWELAGPFNVGGRTRAVALDVTNENTIIAGGVSGGIWKSTNGGSTWRRTSDPQIRNSITTLAQDTRPGKEHIWYFGSGELVGNSARGGASPYRGDGIFKSTDGGESWVQLATTQDSDPSRFGSQFQYIWRIITDHSDTNNDVVLAAAFGGILRSADGGETWQTVLGEKLFDLPLSIDLNTISAPFYTEIAQAENGEFYAYLSQQTLGNGTYPGGMYWSADGTTWKKIGSFSVTNLSRAVLDVHGNSAYFFASANDASYLFRFDRTGVNATGVTGNWNNLTPNLPNFDGLSALNIQGGYNMMIRVHPTNQNLVYLGATNLYRSTDAFISPNNIKKIGGYSDEDNGSLYLNHHPDQHELLFYPSNPNRMLSANDGGVRRTNDGTATTVSWTSLNNGYITSQFYTIDIPKNETSNIIAGGLQDNGSWMNISSQQNAVWYSILGGDGAYTASVPGGLYRYFSFQNSEIYRLTLDNNLNLTSFARVDPTGGAQETGGTYLFINPYVLDPSNPNIMYLAGGNAIWRNNNLAQIPGGSQNTTAVNWQLLSQTTTTGSISALEITSKSKYLYYGSSMSELFRLTDPVSRDGGSIQNIWQSNLPQGAAYVSCVAANPEDDDELLLIISNYGSRSIFHSTNAGDEFADVGGNLEEFVDGSGNGPSIRWAEIVPLANGKRYFVGTSVGLYSTDELNGASTVWVKESPDLIGNAVVRMMDYRPLDGTLVVATHGNGVFRTKVQGFKSIPPAQANVPERFATTRSFPNPFSTRTRIEFDIPATNYLQVDIYYLSGQFVRNLFLGPQFAGTSVVSWDGRNQYGQQVPKGMYIYRIVYDGLAATGKIVYDP